MLVIRRWNSDEWDVSEEARDQFELKRMFKEIMKNADNVENKPTPGYSKETLSRCIVARCSFIPDTKYVIHISGFTVEDITEIHSTADEYKHWD